MAEKLIQQSLERVRIKSYRLFLFMQSPKLGKVPVLDKLVNLIMRLGAQKWRSSIVHDEQNDSSRKEISLKSSVSTFLHFWRFISLSSDSWRQNTVLLVAFAECWKTKVWNLEIEVAVEQNIFGFKISVSNALIIKELDGFDELFEQCATNFGSKSALFWNEIKQFPLSILQNDHCSFLAFGTEFDSRIEICVNDAYQVFKFEFFQELNLSFKAFILVKSLTVYFKGIDFVPFASEIYTKCKKCLT